MAHDAPLERDRYDPAALLSQLTGQVPGTDGGEWCFRFDLAGEWTPAYLPADVREHGTARSHLTEFLKQIRELDNSVQASLEARWRSTGWALQNFKLYIGWIRVGDRLITVRYWGTIVNTEHEVVFQRCEDGRWVPVGEDA
jgi:hypothetical protein